MEINRLKLTNFRAFEQVEFEFQPGMNLLVGINGVGKSTILDALRIALSRVLPNFTVCNEKVQKVLNFDTDDIMFGHDTLDVEIDFQASEIPFQCNVSRGKTGKRNKTELRPNNWQIQDIIKNQENQPLILYFATRRSILTEDKRRIFNQGEFSQEFAFYDALIPRMLRLEEFTDWWVAQKHLVNENSKLAQRNINILNDAVKEFLEDWFTNVRVIPIAENSEKQTIAVDKDGKTLKINQLSDGEKGILALVLELVKRLLLANPGLENPLQDGKAIVLIDELDLHLHPSWQRNIVKKLTKIFPQCQFIATTHSPQIIGEVDAENVIIITNDKQFYLPDQSLGMDTNWILEHLMETPERDINTQNDLEYIESLIQDRKFSEATEKINNIRRELGGEFPDLVRLQTRIERIKRLGK